MAVNAPTIEFTGVEQLAKAIEQHDQKVKRYVAAQVLRAAQVDAPAWMKQNAPWTDRSGNARAGLHAVPKSIEQGKAFEIAFAGSVFYQIYLETRFSGKYAILMPAANYIGKLLLQRIGEGLDKLEAVS